MAPPLSVAAAARLSGITRPAIDRHVNAGRIARSGVGLDRESFDAWLDARGGPRPATARATRAVPASVDGASAELQGRLTGIRHDVLGELSA